MSTQSYGTARIFAFIGFIFYILAAAAGGFGLLILGVAASIVSSVPTPTSAFSFSIIGFIPLIFGIFFIPAIVVAFFAWTTIRAIERGNYMQARTNSPILGIVGLVFGVFIGGVFLPPNARFCPRCGKEQPL
jgi:uncharacterized membrane protein YidH (DUF202 family)